MENEKNAVLEKFSSYFTNTPYMNKFMDNPKKWSFFMGMHVLAFQRTSLEDATALKSIKDDHYKFIEWLTKHEYLQEHEETLYRECVEEFLVVIEKEESSKLIAMVGVIGCGKTTLSQELSKRMKLVLYEELSIDVPCLKSFYKDKKSWSFFIQIYFLLRRRKNIKKGIDIIDRSFEEDIIFAKTLYDDGDMTYPEYELYMVHRNITLKEIKTPDIYIYLETSTDVAYKNIMQRGRESEKDIDIHYIDKLNKTYEWFILESIDKNKVITLNWEKFGDVSEVVNLINKRL